MWDYITGQCKKTYQGHTNKQYSLGGTFGVSRRQTESEKAFIATGSEDGKVFIWDINTKEILQEWQAHEDVVLGVDAHATKELLVTCSLDGGIKVWSNDKEFAAENAELTQDSMEVDAVQTKDTVNGANGGEMMAYDTPVERLSPSA